MKDIIVFGSGGHLGVTLDIIEKQGEYDVRTILCDYGKLGEKIFEYQIEGKLDQLINYSVNLGFVAVGDNYFRKKYVDRIQEIRNDFVFVSAIHPMSVIGKGVAIGEGTFIQAGVIVSAGAAIGKHCIINTNASVGHDVVLEDYVTIGPGVTVGGNTKVCTGSSINMGSIVRNKVIIGHHSIIGMGSNVIKDIPPLVVALGSPAKILKYRQESDKCL